MQTLGKQIRKRLVVRLYVVLAIFTTLILYILSHSIYLSILDKKKSLNSIASQVSEFIVSQEALGTNNSISQVLKQLGANNAVKINLKKTVSPVRKEVSWIFPFELEYHYTVRNFQGSVYGVLLLTTPIFSADSVVVLLKQMIVWLLVLIGFFVTIIPLFSKLPKELIIDPIHNLLFLFNKENHDNENIKNFNFTSIELLEIGKKIEALLQDVKKHSRDIAIGQVASQVAHDIRSPLAALTILMDHENDMAQDKKVLLYNVIQRINDIANNLLKNNEEQLLSHFKHGKDEVQDGFVFPTINSILLEKKLELSGKADVQVKISNDFYRAYGCINKSTFARIISNIINNAAQAVANDGIINVILDVRQKDCIIAIIDNGHGIPQDVMHRIFDYGFSYDKNDGSGIGLAHAKSNIESWGGQINIVSEIGVGTEVTIKLPALASPSWLGSAINIVEGSVVVIVDDDQSIHDAWESHLKKAADQQNSTIDFVHLYSPNDFDQWYFTKNTECCYHYLVDYDFNTFSSGIDLIDRYDISKYAFLVTSKYEDYAIINQCKSKQILLIPKMLFQYVDIQFCSINPDLIFIDDDINLGKAWKYKADFLDKKIVYFNNAQDFHKLKRYYSKSTPIYIDSDLKADQSGEEYAKDFYDFGYDHIYLATGMSANAKYKPIWIKEIVSKDPPF